MNVCNGTNLLQACWTTFPALPAKATKPWPIAPHSHLMPLSKTSVQQTTKAHAKVKMINSPRSGEILNGNGNGWEATSLVLHSVFFHSLLVINLLSIYHCLEMAFGFSSFYFIFLDSGNHVGTRENLKAAQKSGYAKK